MVFLSPFFLFGFSLSLMTRLRAFRDNLGKVDNMEAREALKQVSRLELVRMSEEAFNTLYSVAYENNINATTLAG
jgi:hypothetical protein